MEKSSRVIAVVALCVAVVGLTLGFAAFSNTLTIESSANVKPDANTFNVDFSSSESALETNPVTAVTEPGGLTTGPATISNVGSPTISGLSVEFTEPGQKATYTFYARNEGEYTAFLKSINYANAEGGSAPRKCTATGEASEDLVLAACEDITLSVKVGSESAVTGTNASITGHTLNKDASEKIVVEIEYAADGTRVDGEFSVEFGDVSLTYSSVE